MGGGGGSFFPRSPRTIRNLIEKAREEAKQQCQKAEVNKLINDSLIILNERDTDKIRNYLEDIQKILSEKIETEQFLFGGSVAKHTYVDGLSDVDALAILSEADLADKSPQYILNAFHKLLKDNLTKDKVKSIEKGTLAVTVNYRDGTEIQILPALRVAAKVSIPDAWGKNWKETNPKAFQQALTNANERLHSSLMPAIKMAKSIISGFPEQKRLTGYHVESLAIEAVKGYRGTKTVQAVLKHIFDDASSRVKRPISDVTGQSRVVDQYLGRANSTERLKVANTLASISRRLNAATTVEQWKSILED